MWNKLIDELLKRKIRRVKLIVMDVDGTLTDGLIILDSQGIETKHFHVKDGMGITRAREAGLLTAIITARESEIVLHRAKELGLSAVKQNAKNKLQALDEIIQQFRLKEDQIAYIGDDINDISISQRVGVSFAVHDAAEELKVVVDYVLTKDGGKGAVREAIDIILKCIFD